MSGEAGAAVERLRQSVAQFLAELEGASAAAWSRCPPGEEWSLAETVEHVAIATHGTLARLEGPLLGAPLPPDAPRFDDARIDAGMFRLDGPAPALAVPTGRFPTREEGVAALRAAVEGVAAFVANAPQDLRGYGLPHPVFGVFDGVQWIQFAAAHADNHTPQLRAIRTALAREGQPGV